MKAENKVTYKASSAQHNDLYGWHEKATDLALSFLITEAKWEF